MATLVLASQSPARLKILREAGVDPYVHVSGVDEEAIVATARARYGQLTPADTVLLLAKAKAEAVAADLAGGSKDTGDLIVLGCDSMLDIDGEAVGKPHTVDAARSRVRQQSGRVATLNTGHWLIDLRKDDMGGTHGATGATSAAAIHFARLSDSEIDAYVASGEPLEVAGAFTIDGLGGAFIDSIDGDYHGVVGVSLPLVRNLLSSFEIAFFELWRPGTDRMSTCHV